MLYTDEQGNHLIEGSLIDTKTRANLTEARVSKLTAIDFSKLPLKDAIVWKQGSGARKLVVFADPNCGYCKKFERDLQQVKDVTVYTFLYPILGNDSSDKSRNIWCAKDSDQGLARLDDRRHADPGERGPVRCVGAAAQRRARPQVPDHRDARPRVRGRHPQAGRGARCARSSSCSRPARRRADRRGGGRRRLTVAHGTPAPALP